MEKLYYDIDMNNIPKHVAIIMDGNGRWAKSRLMPRNYGHKAGVETIQRVVKESKRLGIKNLTLYAFSTENWKRPQEEVGALMKLLVTYLKKELKELDENGVRITTIGDISKLPQVCIDELERSMEKTKDNDGLILTLALNYGGRADIIHAIKNICIDVQENRMCIDDIDENIVKNHLYTAEFLDPELVIRTSGEKRLSNFLLWEVAYSEFYYTDVNWPDFDEEELQRAIYSYQNRDRRFGGIK